MSDPRDEACAKEALAITGRTAKWETLLEQYRDALIEAARLGREGWTPTDPLLIRAREIVANANEDAKNYAGAVLAGRDDGCFEVQMVLAALREGIRMAKEGSDV